MAQNHFSDVVNQVQNFTEPTNERLIHGIAEQMQQSGNLNIPTRQTGTPTGETAVN